MARATQNIAAPSVQTPLKRKTVTVASKLPMSIEIQLCRPKESRVTGQFGSTTETVNVKQGAIYVIRGVGHPVGQTPKGFPKAPEMVESSGFALTHGVDADWFAEWLEQNKETEMVQSGLIQAHGDVEYLEDKTTAEYAKLDSGLGPLNPEGDPRQPKSVNSAVSEIRSEPRPSA